MALNGIGRVALITGASTGIGRASAVALAGAGFKLALGARRTQKLEALAHEIEEQTGHLPLVSALDVTDTSSCADFLQKTLDTYGQINVLFNNAGLARGTSYVADTTDEADWHEMIDTNVKGLLHMTRLALPHLIASGQGHVVNMGSIAGREAYAGGAVYCATKFAVRAITEAIRHELLGKPVRVTTIDPGMVETEFSVVRFHGDQQKADDVYANMTPLTAEDIADCILFAVTRPAHVNLDAMVLKPLDQSGAGKVARHV